jgi:hypothetical protein
MSMNLISCIHTACRTAEVGNPSWVVVVLPTDSDTHKSFDKVAGALFPKGVFFSGRTATLPKGGKVSVVSAHIPVFVPEDEPFQVMFFGWSDDLMSKPEDMQRWRDKAVRVLT